MSLEDVQEENDNLKIKLFELQSELDSKNQQLYEYQRNLKTAEVLEKEYQQEIEDLQKGEKTECKKLQARIQQLEEELARTNETYDEQVQRLESTVNEQKQDIEQLHKDLENVTTKISTVSSDDLKRLSDENFKLNNESQVLNDTVNKLQECLEEYQKLNLSLEQKLNILQEELEVSRQTVSCKKAELEEANNLIQTLQEDFIFTKSELDSLRTKPLDENSKGNSLFAEVEDKRVQMKKRLSYMKSKYLEMKEERKNHLKQITQLRNENLSIHRQWKSDLEKHENDVEILINNYYSDRIKTLENLVEKYKEELAQRKPNKIFNEECKFFDSMLKLKSEEIEDLREKLNSQSLSNSILARQLHEVKREVNKWRQQAMQLKSECEQLHNEIQEHKCVNENDDIDTIDEIYTSVVEPKLKSALKTDADVIMKPVKVHQENFEDIKENVDVKETIIKNESSKQVSFKENTTVSNNVYTRNGRSKISFAKPIVIPSVTKKPS